MEDELLFSLVVRDSYFYIGLITIARFIFCSHCYGINTAISFPRSFVPLIIVPVAPVMNPTRNAITMDRIAVSFFILNFSILKIFYLNLIDLSNMKKSSSSKIFLLTSKFIFIKILLVRYFMKILQSYKFTGWGFLQFCRTSFYSPLHFFCFYLLDKLRPATAKPVSILGKALKIAFS